jgi:mRNA-degrading endonuclease RelE of RelBE toxin-antitoxin system
MEKLAKALARMPAKDCVGISRIIDRIKIKDFSGLDFKKLSGQDNIYRIRSGDWRIIYALVNDYAVILAVERRADTTYNF